MSFLASVSDLVVEANMGPLRVNRPGAPVANTYGGCDYPSPHTFALDPVHVQTVTGRELDAAPEADRRKENICLYTRLELLVTEDQDGSDQIEYHGRSYRCTKSEDWSDHGSLYFAIAVLEDSPFPSEYSA